MKILDELWYGNIAPFEQSACGDKRFAELLKLVNQNREELVGTLADKQKETLEKYEETVKFDDKRKAMITMQENKLPKGKENKASENPLEETTTYRIEGRSFVVKPVFKEGNANTFGAILLRLMQADCESKS